MIIKEHERENYHPDAVYRDSQGRWQVDVGKHRERMGGQADSLNEILNLPPPSQWLPSNLPTFPPLPSSVPSTPEPLALVLGPENEWELRRRLDRVERTMPLGQSPERLKEIKGAVERKFRADLIDRHVKDAQERLSREFGPLAREVPYRVVVETHHRLMDLVAALPTGKVPLYPEALADAIRRALAPLTELLPPHPHEARIAELADRIYDVRIGDGPKPPVVLGEFLYHTPTDEAARCGVVGRVGPSAVPKPRRRCDWMPTTDDLPKNPVANGAR